jgi:hypothetical protein
MAPDQGQTVREGRLGFVVPRRGLNGDLPAGAQAQRQHGDQGEQAQQDRRGPGDGFVGPLALGF